MAGADVILMPSRYEPCGLTSSYGLRYGTLPLVHRVGGLADTVVDCSEENMKAGTATGFTFDGFYYDAFMRAIHRAFELFATNQNGRSCSAMRWHSNSAGHRCKNIFCRSTSRSATSTKERSLTRGGWKIARM